MLALTWPGVGGFPPDATTEHLDGKSRFSQETKVGVLTSLAKHISVAAGFPNAAGDDTEEEETLQSHRCVLTARTPREGSPLVFIPALNLLCKPLYSRILP